ncbi:hypothetical protein ACFQXB_10725 [Plastorhodobacter daqingensis]|uniref:Uncharacterized protein n=1 Tax=Plastorhodobacter daqingensis TaxID=1387281 RepID=A0ABW2UMA8_9RHOB
MSLWKAERRIVQLYREAIIASANDAPEFRLLAEQCAAAEQSLTRIAEMAGGRQPMQAAEWAGLA